MSEPSSPTSQPSRPRPGGLRRWSAADKARYLAAFAKSGLSIKAFCAEAGVARSTFILWQHQARIAAAPGAAPTRRATPSFAQVEVVASGACAGITLVIRSSQDVVAEFAGLDRTAAVMLLSTALQQRR